MIRRIFGILVLLFALGLHHAHATLVEHGTYFTDTTTNLDWLTNTPLAGQSHNSVLGGFGGYTTLGWRFATGAELNALVSAQVGPVSPWCWQRMRGPTTERTGKCSGWASEPFK